MSHPELKPIHLLRLANGQSDLVESAVAMHMACRGCGGRGGAPIHPEQRCPDCGFTFADSYGVEAVMVEIERKRAEQ